MKKVLFDCDNTMGLAHCDVDDGLSLLFLERDPRIELCGVTTTFGNADHDKVYTRTEKLMREMKIDAVPLVSMPQAPDFLVDTVDKNPHEMTVIATGSLHNLAGAVRLDPEFVAKTKQFILMGGITAPLYLSGKEMKELNFSCDHRAAVTFFEAVAREMQKENAGKKLSILTANHCLDGFVTRDELHEFLSAPTELTAYIKNNASEWFDYHMTDYGIGYLIIWDILACLYLTDPDAYHEEIDTLFIHPEKMKKGYLSKEALEDAFPLKVNTPKVRSRDTLIAKMREVLF